MGAKPAKQAAYSRKGTGRLEGAARTGGGAILATTFVLALGAFATLAGSAGAVVVKLADGRTVSYLPPVAGGPLASPFARVKAGEPGRRR